MLRNETRDQTPTETHHPHVAPAAADHRRLDTQPTSVGGGHSIDQICGALIDLQVRRKFVIKLETATTNTSKALAARMCGFDASADEASREKVWKRAGAIVSKALAQKAQAEENQQIATFIAIDLEVVRLMLIPLETRRKEIEDEMSRLALSLPVAPFIKTIAGFDARGLAVIVGEAGNLSNYPDKGRPSSSGPACLWRRFGLATAKGHEAKAYSTWRKEGLKGIDQKAEEFWTEAGYSPKRLGQLYGVVTVPLFMAKAKNKYGEVYLARRARTMVTHPEWYVDKNGKAKVSPNGEPSSAHASEDAKRVMVKAFLDDLWREWRRTC
jgi:hypothetical protein